MLDEICAYLRNWFSYPEDQYVGGFVIRDGTLPLIFIDGTPYSAHANDGTVTNDGFVFAAKISGMPYTPHENDGTVTQDGYVLDSRQPVCPYIRIIGSRYNDGVYKYDNGGVTGLVDEEFYGAVWVMSLPPALESLDAEITAWMQANADAINSPYQSESFGGYSYSKGYQSGAAQTVTWQGQFGARLARWRKI